MADDDSGPVGPQSEGPVGPPPPGVADAPAVSHNPVAAVFAHPGAVHNPLIRVASKIGSMVTSPGVIHAARTALEGVQAVGQGALEGMHPQEGAIAIKRQEAPSVIQKNVAQAGEATAGAGLKDVQTEEAKKGKTLTPDEQAFKGYTDKHPGDPIGAFQEYQADKRKPSMEAGKIEYNKGLPVSILDDQGTRWDTKNPNLPADLKAHVDTAKSAYNQATADSLKQKIEGYKTLTAPKWAQLGLAQAKNAGEIYQPARDADMRYERMSTDAPKALEGNQQAMLSLLTNHIGMTLGAQKGAHITEAILKEAEVSAPMTEAIDAKFDERGYLSGVVLTPGQIGQMVDLARSQRELIRDSVMNKAAQEGTLTKVPGAPTTSTPSGGRVAAAPPANLLKDGQITHFKNGQSWTLKNGQPTQVK